MGGMDDENFSRIRNLMVTALASEIQLSLGQSDIEHSAYSLELIADRALSAALSFAMSEGLSLQRIVR